MISLQVDRIGACVAEIMRMVVLSVLGFGGGAMTDMIDESTCFVEWKGLQLHAVRQFGIVSFCAARHPPAPSQQTKLALNLESSYKP